MSKRWEIDRLATEMGIKPVKLMVLMGKDGLEDIRRWHGLLESESSERWTHIDYSVRCSNMEFIGQYPIDVYRKE